MDQPVRRGTELSGITDNNVDEDEEINERCDYRHNDSHIAFLIKNKIQTPEAPENWNQVSRPIDKYDITKICK